MIVVLFYMFHFFMRFYKLLILVGVCCYFFTSSESKKSTSLTEYLREKQNAFFEAARSTNIRGEVVDVYYSKRAR
jgi:hypothetical protein